MVIRKTLPVEDWSYRVNEVLDIYDGDTVDLRLDMGFHTFKQERFRILGIDCPELEPRKNVPNRQAEIQAAHWARDRHFQWWNNHKDCDIRVATVKGSLHTDSFGRYLADPLCLNHNNSLAAFMVASDLAVPYKKDKKWRDVYNTKQEDVVDVQ